MKQNILKWKPLLSVCIISGLIQVIVGVIMYLAGFYFHPLSSIVSIVVVILCLILGLLWYRNNHMNGEGSYSQILIVGVFISISIGIIYALYNIISINFFYPHFMEDLINARAEILKSRGLSDKQIEQMISFARTQLTAAGMAVRNFIFLSASGIVSSLVIAIFLRKKSNNN